MLSKQEKITWNDWLKSQGNTSDPNSISRPGWVGQTKGNNPFDFSGKHFFQISIYSAFAEGMTFENATFNHVLFEEGDFSRVNFINCEFTNVKFNKTILTDSNFDGAVFINCSLNRVNLTNSIFTVKQISQTVIYGISAWDIVTSEDSIQNELVIEKTYDLYSDIIQSGRIPMMVDNIELAQFIYYLSNHKKIRDTLNILNNKGVLILGRFADGGLERLHKVREWFAARNYIPMIFDFEHLESMDRTETIVTMGGLSKIVLADVSGSSVPHELHAILINFLKPVIAFHEDKPYSMMDDLVRKNRFFQALAYEDMSGLIEQLPEKVNSAEKDYSQIVKEIAEQYGK